MRTYGVLEHDGDGEDRPNNVCAEELVGCSDQYEQGYKKNREPYFQGEYHSVGLVSAELPHAHHPCFAQEQQPSIAAILSFELVTTNHFLAIHSGEQISTALFREGIDPRTERDLES